MAKRKPSPRGIVVAVPGRKKPIRINCVIIDFNGTLAADGKLVPGVRRRIRSLADLTEVVVMTADTFGTARRALDDLPVAVRVVRGGASKRALVESIGPDTVAAIGNGVNDVPMFRAAALGIAVSGVEGTAADLIAVATVLVRDVNNAIDLILKPRRLLATLRQ